MYCFTRTFQKRNEETCLSTRSSLVFQLWNKAIIWSLIICLCSCSNQNPTGTEVSINRAPNVILVLTDDQGIGDLGCHGNQWIKTPHIDAFYEESVRFTDYHVSPVCTPTRSALMTGRYPINNGAWATYKGRDALSGGVTTMAQIFQENGYKTGIFGKWHLGDNYPVRPSDLGFDVSVIHKAGGVGELSDYWGNNYFDDTYYANNKPKQYEGYCTDVWFQEAIKFIELNKEKPFFTYIATNAPHSPFYVDEKYAAPYQELKGSKIFNPEFYGMITNIDENFGKLEAYLRDSNLADNTILIFMTDNGTSDGISRDGKIGYNMGLRGRKGQHTEGGHRVPYFIRWKGGKIDGGWDIDEETAHVDILPTLASLCQLKLRPELKLDGADCTPLLLKKTKQLEERSLFVHNRQDWRTPKDVDRTCLIKDEWRLINGSELYNIEQDLRQEHDISDQHPEVVDELLSANASFIKESKTNHEYQQFPVAIVGSEHQKEIKLTIQHAIGEGPGIWKSEHVAAGLKNENNTHALQIDTEGYYLISCTRWPRECPGPIRGIPRINPKDWFDYKTIKPTSARIQIANQIIEKPIEENDVEATFKVYLEKGKTFLTNDFIENDESYGVYYTYVSLME